MATTTYDHNAATRRAQARVLEGGGATRRGAGWTQQEIEMVEAFTDATAEELAWALGRTVYGIQTMRHALHAGLHVGGGHDRTTQPVKTSGWTFIDGDVPPGWE